MERLKEHRKFELKIKRLRRQVRLNNKLHLLHLLLETTEWVEKPKMDIHLLKDAGLLK